MKCLDCGGTYVKKHGDIELTDKYIGNFVVRDVSYYKCDGCEEYLFSPETSKVIEDRRNQELENLIRSQPLSAFISGSETAAILGITRQALHKHRRIRRGFIFQTQFGGKTVYMKNSVDLFKKTGDGRYPLKEQEKIHYIKTQVMGSKVS